MRRGDAAGRASMRSRKVTYRSLVAVKTSSRYPVALLTRAEDVPRSGLVVSRVTAPATVSTPLVGWTRPLSNVMSLMAVPVAGGAVGTGVGLAVGTGVGLAVGTGVGLAVGTGVGLAVGTGVGLAVGTGVGVGLAVGTGVGLAVGTGVGVAVGVGVVVRLAGSPLAASWMSSRVTLTAVELVAPMRSRSAPVVQAPVV